MYNNASLPVNLIQLRELIDGDHNLEKRLVGLFIKSSEENLNYLELICNDDEDLEWRNNAHSLKGAACNIGADKLSDICAKAQERYNMSAKDKKIIASIVRKEYNIVKDFLLNSNYYTKY